MVEKFDDWFLRKKKKKAPPRKKSKLIVYVGRRPKLLTEVVVDGSTPETVKRQEEEAARLLQVRGDAKAHVGSGRLSCLKSDFSTRKDRGECKQTADVKIRVQLDWLVKIERESRLKRQVPMLQIRFIATQVDRACDIPGDWWFVPTEFAHELGIVSGPETIVSAASVEVYRDELLSFESMRKASGVEATERFRFTAIDRRNAGSIFDWTMMSGDLLKELIDEYERNGSLEGFAK